MSIEVRIVRLPHAADLPLPAYQTAHAAGLDLMAAVPADAPVDDRAGQPRALIRPDIAIALPPGSEGQIRPRSGLAVATASPCSMRRERSTPTIAENYRSFLSITAPKFSSSGAGCAIAQLVIAAMQHAKLVEIGKPGHRQHAHAGGFGSTGIDVRISVDKRRIRAKFKTGPTQGYVIYYHWTGELDFPSRRCFDPHASASRAKESSPSRRSSTSRCRRRDSRSPPKSLAARHGLPPRHLEPVLQALVRYGILQRRSRSARRLRTGARWPATSPPTIFCVPAGTVEDDDKAHAGSDILDKVVLPAMANAEQEFGVALGRISVEEWRATPGARPVRPAAP